MPERNSVPKSHPDTSVYTDVPFHKAWIKPIWKPPNCGVESSEEVCARRKREKDKTTTSRNNYEGPVSRNGWLFSFKAVWAKFMVRLDIKCQVIAQPERDPWETMHTGFKNCLRRCSNTVNGLCKLLSQCHARLLGMKNKMKTVLVPAALTKTLRRTQHQTQQKCFVKLSTAELKLSKLLHEEESLVLNLQGTSGVTELLGYGTNR